MITYREAAKVVGMTSLKLTITQRPFPPDFQVKIERLQKQILVDFGLKDLEEVSMDAVLSPVAEAILEEIREIRKGVIQ